MKTIPLKVTAVKKVLPFLAKYQVKNGYAPTNREIASQFKYKSAFMGNLLLRALEESGYIKIPRTKLGRAKLRNIKVLKTK